MAVEWKVLEEEDALARLEAEPEADEAPTPRRWRWLLALLGALVIVGAVAGSALFAQARRQEARLRAELAEVVRAEARAQSFGLEEESRRWVDPAAPAEWRQRYAALFQRLPYDDLGWLFPIPVLPWRPPETAPELRAVTLDRSGQRARVEVAWVGRSEVREQRAYRLVGGQWRRTPLRSEAAEGPPLESESDHFLLRADPHAMEALHGGAELLLTLEGLRAHVHATWPRALLRDPNDQNRLLLAIEPRELAPLLLGSEQPATLKLNAPDLAWYYAESPLTLESQQRVGVASTVTRQLLDFEGRFPPPLPDDERYFAYLYLFLPDADAHLWTLDAEERRALRNAWREELAGEWLSPLGYPSFRNDPDVPTVEQIRRWVLSCRLFVEQLREQDLVSSPGAIAQALLAPPRGFAATFEQLTGVSQADLETRAREYALTPE